VITEIGRVVVAGTGQIRRLQERDQLVYFALVHANVIRSLITLAHNRIAGRLLNALCCHFGTTAGNSNSAEMSLTIVRIELKFNYNLTV
jgi:hypothetical protein